MKRKFRITMLIAMLALCARQGSALSFALDSIAEWGSFPRFVVDTYRWGCGFFNGYDTDYVEGTGYKFNVKTVADSWVDFYNFDLPNDFRMHMLTEPCTSVGARLTYMAVSIGYDKNVSKFFGSAAKSRQTYEFGFDCSLFAYYMYWIRSGVGTNVTLFGEKGNTYNPDISFSGLDSSTWGFDTYYFFNHKRYSQAAAFGFSRLQRRSQGSFYAGLSYSNQKFDFDFNALPDYMKQSLPESWTDYRYRASTRNYALKLGYGYNWALGKFTLCVQESPTLGIKVGYVNNEEIRRTSCALYNQLRASLVWNHKRWFAGVVGDIQIGIFYDSDSAFENAFLSATCSVGYRFNIW